MSIKNGALVHEASGTAVQVGSGFVTTDGVTDSPIILTGGVDSITVPTECCEIAIYPVTNDLKVSESSDMSSYDLVSKGNKEPFPLARMPFIYIQGTDGDTVYYRFHYV